RAGAAPARAQNQTPIDSRFDPAKLATPPLRHVAPVTPGRLTLKNGVTVFLLEDHDLPVITGVIDVPATPLLEPGAKAGLARLTGEVMRSGGSAAHSGDWLDDRLAAIGASITTEINNDIAETSFRCLTDNAAEVMGLVAEV